MKVIKKTGDRQKIREITKNATSRRTPTNMKETNKNRRPNETMKNDKNCNLQQNAKDHEGDKETEERLRIREMTKNSTSSRTPRNLKEIRKNRREIENPRNDKELKIQENAKEFERDKGKQEKE